MRLMLKFSLIYVVLFSLGLAVTGYFYREELKKNARQEVLHNAEILLETALGMRSYTSEQIKPAFDEMNAPPAASSSAGDVFSDLCGQRAASRAFRPQTIPAFSAAELFSYVRKKYPEYSYKEAALNPSNPRNRAVDWEEEVIKAFRSKPDLAVYEGTRSTPFGPALFLARPMKAQKSCLACHSTPSEAPPDMVKMYGRQNGFGWHENEVIAAQIVSVPMLLPVTMADAAFRKLATWLCGVGVGTLLLLNLALYLAVIRPVRRFARRADEISKGEMDQPELPVHGRDDIAVLAASFNRMHNSLLAAMQMLEKS